MILIVGSIIIIVIGVLVFLICIFMYTYVEVLKGQLAICVVGFAMGIAIALIGIWGLFASTCCKSMRCCLGIYAIIMIVLAVAMVVIGIVAFAIVPKQ